MATTDRSAGGWAFAIPTCKRRVFQDLKDPSLVRAGACGYLSTLGGWTTILAHHFRSSSRVAMPGMIGPKSKKVSRSRMMA